MEGFSCTYQAIVADVPHQLWEAITSDGAGSTPILVTRMLHNKPLFYAINFARCYFHYLSPHFLSQNLGAILTIGIILGVYYLWYRGGIAWKIIRVIIILYPLIFLFELQRII